MRLLTKLHITPDHLTILSFLFGLAFATLWHLEYYWYGIASLWIHVALDGFDGPLARYQNSASPRGSFTDSFCDQVVVSTVTIMLMVGWPRLSVAAGGDLSCGVHGSPGDFDGEKFSADPKFMAAATSADFIHGDSCSIARRAACNRGRRVVQQRCARD